jgi:hypothetical protein
MYINDMTENCKQIKTHCDQIEPHCDQIEPHCEQSSSACEQSNPSCDQSAAPYVQLAVPCIQSAVPCEQSSGEQSNQSNAHEFLLNAQSELVEAARLKLYFEMESFLGLIKGFDCKTPSVPLVLSTERLKAALNSFEVGFRGLGAINGVDDKEVVDNGLAIDSKDGFENNKKRTLAGGVVCNPCVFNWVDFNGVDFNGVGDSGIESNQGSQVLSTDEPAMNVSYQDVIPSPELIKMIKDNTWSRVSLKL